MNPPTSALKRFDSTKIGVQTLQHLVLSIAIRIYLLYDLRRFDSTRRQHSSGLVLSVTAKIPHCSTRTQHFIVNSKRNPWIQVEFWVHGCVTYFQQCVQCIENNTLNITATILPHMHVAMHASVCQVYVTHSQSSQLQLSCLTWLWLNNSDRTG